MADLNAADLNLDGKSPAELEQIRREMTNTLRTKYADDVDNPDIPPEMLHTLAMVTKLLRRRTAGPPKAAKRSRAPTRQKSVDDLADAF